MFVPDSRYLVATNTGNRVNPYGPMKGMAPEKSTGVNTSSSEEGNIRFVFAKQGCFSGVGCGVAAPAAKLTKLQWPAGEAGSGRSCCGDR